jgi:hypothetical protein
VLVWVAWQHGCACKAKCGMLQAMPANGHGREARLVPWGSQEPQSPPETGKGRELQDRITRRKVAKLLNWVL